MKIALIALCLAMFACTTGAKEINSTPIKLECIEFKYAMPNDSQTRHVTYCFDTKNALCYSTGAHYELNPIDFKNCYDLFQEYIDQPDKAEKE
jgi:hypothetical protein